MVRMVEPPSVEGVRLVISKGGEERGSSGTVGGLSGRIGGFLLPSSSTMPVNILLRSALRCR